MAVSASCIRRNTFEFSLDNASNKTLALYANGSCLCSLRALPSLSSLMPFPRCRLLIEAYAAVPFLKPGLDRSYSTLSVS